jgi:hypothetical protein
MRQRLLMQINVKGRYAPAWALRPQEPCIAALPKERRRLDLQMGGQEGTLRAFLALHSPAPPSPSGITLGPVARGRGERPPGAQREGSRGEPVQCFDRLTFFKKYVDRFSNGFGVVTDENRAWETPTGSATVVAPKQ